jgi:hypothetical protein
LTAKAQDNLTIRFFSDTFSKEEAEKSMKAALLGARIPAPSTTKV